MYLLDVTLDTHVASIALDEALLEWAEDRPAARPSEVLRLWEPSRPLVVVGRSSRLEAEVNLPACQERGIPILRRPSGGAAIVTGPGCLMYAVVLSCRWLPELRAVDRAHTFVLGRISQAIRTTGIEVAHAGTSDLILTATDGTQASARKISGNSLRIKRSHLLYHGTILYDFPLSLISTCLRTPPRQPDYRAARPHDQFVANLPVRAEELRGAIARIWHADELLADWPRQRTAALVRERYSRVEWNERH